MPDDALIRARCLPHGSIVQLLPDGSTRPFTQRSDWARVDAMTEAEVDANVRADANNPPITRTELARMRRVVASE